MTYDSLPEDSASEPTPGREFPLWILLGGFGFALLLGLLAVLSLYPPTKDPRPDVPSVSKDQESKTEVGLTNLVNQPDQENCKAFFAANAARIVRLQNAEATLAPAILAELNEPQKQEVLQKGPTKLDSHYLVDAFFFREIASRLSNTEDLWSSFCQDKNEKKITRFFTWVCRLIAFQAPHPQRPEFAIVNPTLVLKRGFGSGLDRAVVFLNLIEQANGTQGGVAPILIALPPKGAGLSRYLVGVWSVAKKDFWLLDPDLGLPLDLVQPAWGWLGPIVKAPEKIPALQVNQQTWDLEATAISQAKFHLVRSLSSLSPRLQATETLLQQNGVSLYLGRDPAAELAETEKALESIGVAKPASGARVALWKPAIGQLRDYTNPDEGGADEKDIRLQSFQRTVIPLDALPPALRIDLHVGLSPLAGQPGNWLIDFPRWDAGLTELVPFVIADRIANMFAGSFLQSAFEPGKTRDQLLRGKWVKLVPELVGEGDAYKKAQRAYETNKDRIDKEVTSWLVRTEKLYADENRAKRSGPSNEAATISKVIDDSWKVSPLLGVISNALARSRGVEVAYLLAIIRQEEAERSTRGKISEERFMAGWSEASAAWKRFNEELGSGICVDIARSCWAESVFWTGSKDRAIAILEQSPRNVSALQKKILGIKAEVLKRYAKAS